MNWNRSLVRLSVRHLSPRESTIMAGEILPEILSRLPRAERVVFLHEMAKATVGPALRDLGREERAQLMNALLPLFAREFAITVGEILPEVLNRLPHAKRVVFLHEMAEATAGPALRDLGREERAQLMNALLPLFAREFPLADLDLLRAFPAATSPEYTFKM
jgi:hypothetical protein